MVRTDVRIEPIGCLEENIMTEEHRRQQMSQYSSARGSIFNMHAAGLKAPMLTLQAHVQVGATSSCIGAWSCRAPLCYKCITTGKAQPSRRAYVARAQLHNHRMHTRSPAPHTRGQVLCAECRTRRRMRSLQGAESAIVKYVFTCALEAAAAHAVTRGKVAARTRMSSRTAHAHVKPHRTCACLAAPRMPSQIAHARRAAPHQHAH
eukprot:6196704-Pleurochrysis_carterae.AAC.1